MMILKLFLAIAATAFFAVRVTHAAPADELKTLLEQGSPAAAYALAKKNPQELGIPVFDFYFGIAAIDSGHAGEGVIALERYVINFPGNVQARLELARGYFILGDDSRARDEFTDILKATPPTEVAVKIERYLDALRSRESAYRTSAGAFIEYGFGYDSNINGGISKSNLILPNFGLVTIANSGLKTSAGFSQLTAGVAITHPLAPGAALFGSMSGDFKIHMSSKEFDQGSHGITGGASYLKDKNLFRATLSFNQLDVDHGRFRSTAGLTGEWTHQLDEFQVIGGLLQYSTLDYPGNNDSRDSRLSVAGLNYRLAFIGKWQPMLLVSGNFGREDNQRGRDDFARDIVGLRTALSVTPLPKWALSIGATHQQSEYAAPDTLFSTIRRDNYNSLDLTASYALRSNLSLRGEMVVARNYSNQDLYRYRREVFAIKIRHELK